MINVVTGPVNIAHTILIRAIKPDEGAEITLTRRGLSFPRKGWLTGPGTVDQALKINTSHRGIRLDHPDSSIILTDAGLTIQAGQVHSGPRIGVQYAGADALLPWRFSWIDM